MCPANLGISVCTTCLFQYRPLLLMRKLRPEGLAPLPGHQPAGGRAICQRGRLPREPTVLYELGEQSQGPVLVPQVEGGQGPLSGGTRSRVRTQFPLTLSR